jgi:hypothetical protein
MALIFRRLDFFASLAMTLVRQRSEAVCTNAVVGIAAIA